MKQRERFEEEINYDDYIKKKVIMMIALKKIMIMIRLRKCS